MIVQPILENSLLNFHHFRDAADAIQSEFPLELRNYIRAAAKGQDLKVFPPQILVRFDGIYSDQMASTEVMEKAREFLPVIDLIETPAANRTEKDYAAMMRFLSSGRLEHEAQSHGYGIHQIIYDHYYFTSESKD